MKIGDFLDYRTKVYAPYIYHLNYNPDPVSDHDKDQGSVTNIGRDPDPSAELNTMPDQESRL